MSTPIPPPVAVAPPVIPAKTGPREIKLISHSPLFYWWPVWVFGFGMAIWTYMENHRFMVVPSDTAVMTQKVPNGTASTYNLSSSKDMTKPFKEAVKLSEADMKIEAFPVRVSQHAWLGTLYAFVLVLTVFITNVPLRGLLSFMVIILLVVVALFVTVFHGWDDVYEKVENLRIYINLAGYLLISTAVFTIWAVATFFFDRRTYILFSPGQIKVCEHIGASVRTFDASGVSFEKQRDDLFRHYILGFGSGDLIVRTSGAERSEIRMQNVLGIGWKLKPVEDLLREKIITTNT